MTGDCRGRRLTPHDHLVVGVAVDDETRCAHYHSDRDVVAIQFPCCETYYPCFRCHERCVDHDAERWPRGRFDEPAVLCGACGETLSAGDRVRVALTCYEDHSWEMEGVYCETHAVDSVAETMGVRAENQAVVAAVLEPAGYLPPDGAFEADALTLGAVEVLDYSPTADGY